MTIELRRLIAAVLGGQLSLKAAIARLGAPGARAAAARQVRALVEETGRSLGNDPQRDLVACELSWAAVQHDDNAALRTRAALDAAGAHLRLGGVDRAEEFLEFAERAIEASGSRAHVPEALSVRAWIDLERNRLPAAVQTLRRALRVADELEDPYARLTPLDLLARALAQGGDAPGARDALRVRIELARSVGERRHEFAALRELASLSEGIERLRLLREADALSALAPASRAERIRLLADLAAAERAAANPAAAERCYRHGLQLATEHGDPRVIEVFAGNLGALLVDHGDPAQAEEFCRRALAIAHEVGDTQGASIYEHNLRRLRNRHSTAATVVAPHAKRSLARRPSPRVTAALEALLHVAREIRHAPHAASRIIERVEQVAIDDAMAEEVAETALDTIAEFDGTDPRLAYSLALVVDRWMPDRVGSLARIRVLEHIGRYSANAHDLRMAVDAYAGAAAIARASGEMRHWLTATANLATVLRQAGRTADAMAVYKQAVEALGPSTDPVIQAQVLTNASTAYADAGRADEAFALDQRAIELLEGAGIRDEAYLVAKMNSATRLHADGDPDRAERVLLEALQLARELRIPSQEGVALGNLGLVRVQQQRVGEAIRYLERARIMARDTQDPWNEQHWTRDLANLYAATGARDLAVELYETGIALAERIGDVRSRALCQLGLGCVLRGDDADKAWGALSEAMSSFLATGNVALAAEAGIRMAQACLGRALGLDTVSALELLRSSRATIRDAQALDEAEQQLEAAQRLASQDGSQRGLAELAATQALVAWHRGRREEAIARLQAAPRSIAPMGRAAIESQLAHFLAAQGRPADALPHVDEAIALYERVCSGLHGEVHRLQFRNDYARLYVDAVEAAVACGQAQRAFAYAEASKAVELRRLRPDIGAQSPRLDDVRRWAAQRPRCAVVELMPCAEQTFAFVFAAGIPEGQELVTIRDASWRASLGPLLQYMTARAGASGDDPAAEHMWLSGLEHWCATARALLEPIVHKLDRLDLEEIVFVAHSALHLLPLHAVEVAGVALLDRCVVSYSPAAALLLAGEAPQPQTVRFGAIADTTGDLPFARAEADFAAAAVGGGQGVAVGRLDRAQAAEILRSSNWIHFACHAQQSLGDPDLSGIVLGPSRGDDSGLLSLPAITRDIRLARGSTVILSACETGMIWPIFSGEVVSVAAAFVIAGASRVVATQWPVDDACACLLLRRLYTVLPEERTLTRALRAAQLWTRSLTQREAHDELAAIVRGMPAMARGDCEARLNDFAARRTDVRPFEHPGSWGAFFVIRG